MKRKERTEASDLLIAECFVKGPEYFIRKMHETAERPMRTQNPAFVPQSERSLRYKNRRPGDRTEYLDYTPLWQDTPYLVLRAQINANPNEYFNSFPGQEIFIPINGEVAYTFLRAPKKTESVIVSPDSFLRAHTQIPHQRNGQGEGWLIVYDEFKAACRFYARAELPETENNRDRTNNILLEDNELRSNRHYMIASGLVHFIRNRRYQLGLTIAEAAEISGCSKSLIHQFERGCTALRPSNLSALFKAFEIFELPPLPSKPYDLEKIISPTKKQERSPFDVQILQFKKGHVYAHNTAAERESWIANKGMIKFDSATGTKLLAGGEVIHFRKPGSLTVNALEDCLLIRASYTP